MLDFILADDDPTCIWPRCDMIRVKETLPLCLDHTMLVIGQFSKLREDRPRRAKIKSDPVPCVYYLMVGPSTVKIGTTISLRKRISQLRTEMQYVVAIEPGGSELERQRHLEFANERIGRRENFRLSDQLKNHIEALQPERDELIALALQEGSPCRLPQSAFHTSSPRI